MDALKVSEADLVVYVHPAKARNVPRAILCELSSFLFKFNETFEGVLLAYDVNALDNKAKILNGVQPYFGVILKAKLLLFCPRVDMLLEGKVVKVSRESIHVIVLGFASAIIIEENIRDDFKYSTKHDKGRFVSSSNKHHTIKVGTMIRFVVKSFDEEILHFSGSLLPNNTGSIRWLEKPSEIDSQVERSVDKNRKKERRHIMEQDAQMANGGVNSDLQLQKSKRRKTVES